MYADARRDAAGAAAPKQFDVIVTDNLFGDILLRDCRGDADRQPWACCRRRQPGGSRHERGPPQGACTSRCTARPRTLPVGKANPLACILCYAMALRYSFDQGDEAARIEAAVEAVLADGARTADLLGPDGGEAVTTGEMGDRILAALDASL